MKVTETAAVVPVKELALAKRRLEAVLTATDRRRLSLAMLSIVLTRLKQVKGLDAVTLISRDADAIALADGLDVRVLAETGNGLNTAVVEASRLLAGEDYSTLLVVPADVPLISTSDVSRILEARLEGASVTVVPDRSETGTNALACSPPDAISPCFGDNSLANHLSAARDGRIAARVLALNSLALDIDSPDDLAELTARLPETSHYDALRSLLRHLERDGGSREPNDRE